MATDAQRLAALETEVARLREDLSATRHVGEIFFEAGRDFAAARSADAKYRAAAVASRPRSRHLRAVAGSAR
jgi:hypothetical protein